MLFDSHHFVPALALTALIAVPALGDLGAVDVAEIPFAVRRAADKAAPACTWTKAVALAKRSQASDVKGPATKFGIYQLSGRNREGRETEAVVTARGKVLEVRTEIPCDDVPKVVADAFKAQSRGLKPTDVKSVAVRGEILWYQFKGKNALGREVVILVSADGEMVKEWHEASKELHPTRAPEGGRTFGIQSPRVSHVRQTRSPGEESGRAYTETCQGQRVKAAEEAFGYSQLVNRRWPAMLGGQVLGA
jgi:hypothetical protein